MNAKSLDSFWLCIGLLLLVPVSSSGAEDSAQAEQKPSAEALFVRRILPLLHEKCISCHGGERDKIEGALDLTSEAGTFNGGESGEPSVVRGKSVESPLLLAVLRTHDTWSAMPPKEAEQLSDQQREWLREWIDAGAPWPSASRQQEISKQFADAWSAEDGIVVATSGGLSETWMQRKYQPAGLWAYQPLKQPAVEESDITPVDQLVALHLPAGLCPAPRADRRTLIRRATFDLTGLPPTHDEVSQFLADPASDREAFAQLVERLLASPHYGERMAQHWLDVVRYADSSGFANDYDRGNAWRYRDYVIRAFNADKPFDQFIREQIAGDELSPDDPEALIATGFLRMGPWELTGMEVAKVARQRFLDDVTNSVGETFLAHSLQCARCHDHKFDPVPTRDYYSIQAVFATTQLAERKAPFLPTENTAGFEEEAYLERTRQEHLATLEALEGILLENANRWFEEHQKPRDAWDRALEKVKGQGTARNVFNATREALIRQGVSQEEFPPKLVGFTPQQFGMERVARKGLERLNWEFDRYRPFALSVYNGVTPQVKSVNAPTRIPADPTKQGELEQTTILAGGDPFSPSIPVAPGILSVVPCGHDEPITDSIAGRRSHFAEWVADPRNPLTARVIANRLWLWHFNEPIAGNPNNFGSTGKRPTHPELLDWLASTLIENGWSLKQLHREIMRSEAYCRSVRHPNPRLVAERDPTGSSLAVFRPRRLTAEELRDALLVSTGELNPVLGGIPCRPEIHPEVALQPRQVMGTFAAAWTPNPLPSQRHRRSIYVLKLRGLSDPLMEVFNAPGPDFSCERRETSTVTPQVFALFNGMGTHTRSLALAVDVMRDTTTDAAAITACFQRVFSRDPTSDELSACLEHWRNIEPLLPAEAPAHHLPREIVREAVEENTGERFTFRETLYANADFVPDVQPDAVDRHVRALADVCLILFNTHEFSYVY